MPESQAKFLSYPNCAGVSKIAYAIFPGHRCVFTGLTRTGTPTVNMAPDIILLIAAMERTVWQELRFFDLRTHLQYGHGSYSPHPGEFLYDWLKVESVLVNGSGWLPSVTDWRPEECPAEVVACFAKYIGGDDPYQIDGLTYHHRRSESHVSLSAGTKSPA